jgi:hypothetical protein
VIGPPFSCDRSGGDTMKLKYSFPFIKQIETGIRRLSEAIKEIMRKQNLRVVARSPAAGGTTKQSPI